MFAHDRLPWRYKEGRYDRCIALQGLLVAADAQHLS
jgi:hypothetical protein